MNRLLQDRRYAVHQVRKSPGFAVTAVPSLTLGIGTTTRIFSVVYSILLDPHPYRDADRMVPAVGLGTGLSGAVFNGPHHARHVVRCRRA
jgi:hypothetical protein